MSEVYRSGSRRSRQPTRRRNQLWASALRDLPQGDLPQAFRIVLPALGNYLIALFKDTALGLRRDGQELMFSGQIIAARNYQYFTVYTITAILYFAVGYPSALLVRRLEASSSRSLRIAGKTAALPQPRGIKRATPQRQSAHAVRRP